jgi:ATP-dependent Clp protease ATP-binding subunit ClpX
MDGVTLQFTRRALRAIARRALTLVMGARGLRTVLESSMLDLMYEKPRSRLVRVTEGLVESGQRPDQRPPARQH